MYWKIEKEKVTGFNNIDNKAREHSFEVVITHGNTEHVVAKSNNYQNALRLMTNAQYDLQRQMEKNKNMHSRVVAVVQHRKDGMRIGEKDRLVWMSKKTTVRKVQEIINVRPKKVRPKN